MSNAVVTVQDTTLVLPRVSRVLSVKAVEENKFAWAVVFSSKAAIWFTWPTRKEADQSHREFVRALTDYWAGQQQARV